MWTIKAAPCGSGIFGHPPGYSPWRQPGDLLEGAKN